MYDYLTCVCNTGRVCSSGTHEDAHYVSSHPFGSCITTEAISPTLIRVSDCSLEMDPENLIAAQKQATLC